jgi:anaerobic ribonucleoside-triphosphate reductase activating protein
MNSRSISPEVALAAIPPGYLNMMGYVDESEVNGPGRRAVVWVQGCMRECPGCFNPDSWSFEPNQLIAVNDLAQKILSNPRNEGVTFSGGEPFWQASSLAALAQQVKAAGLNVMSFTGFTLAQLQSPNAPVGSRALLNQLDLLVDGPFVESLAVYSPDSPVSSSNQRVRVLNPEFTGELTWASNQVEVHVFPNGDRLITGYRGQMETSNDLSR